jgi:hypothetical protein
MKKYMDQYDLYQVYEDAVVDGDLERIIALYNNGHILPDEYICSIASSYGHFHILEFLEYIESYIMDSWECIYQSVVNNQIQTCLWLHAHGHIFQEREIEYDQHDKYNICAIAAINGHFGILTILHEELGYTLTQKTIEWAAAGSNHQIIDYLQHHGCRLTPKVMRCAIEEEDLDMVKYLHSINCPYTILETTFAIQLNAKHIIEYMIEHQFEFDMENEYVKKYMNKHFKT